MLQRHSAVSRVLPTVPALCTLLVGRCLHSQSVQSTQLCDSSTCSMPNNIPSAVSMLPQNKQSVPSDEHRKVLKSEGSWETCMKHPYDASVLLRAPLRALNRLDQAESEQGKGAVQHAPSGVPELDAALKGVHVDRLSDGVISRILPCCSGFSCAFALLAIALPPS